MVDSSRFKTKDYGIGICCSFAKHVALRTKSQDCMTQNQNNMSQWSDMLTGGLYVLI